MCQITTALCWYFKIPSCSHGPHNNSHCLKLRALRADYTTRTMQRREAPNGRPAAPQSRPSQPLLALQLQGHEPKVFPPTGWKPSPNFLHTYIKSRSVVMLLFSFRQPCPFLEIYFLSPLKLVEQPHLVFAFLWLDKPAQAVPVSFSPAHVHRDTVLCHLEFWDRTAGISQTRSPLNSGTNTSPSPQEISHLGHHPATTFPYSRL